MPEISRQEVANWLLRWAEKVRLQDYAGAKTMFSPACVSFGTVAGKTADLDELVARQWQRVWGRTQGFAFDIDSLDILPGEDMAVAIVQWESTGLSSAQDDAPFARVGRATVVLRLEDGALLCHHTHFSIEPLVEPFLK